MDGEQCFDAGANLGTLLLAASQNRPKPQFVSTRGSIASCLGLTCQIVFDHAVVFITIKQTGECVETPQDLQALLVSLGSIRLVNMLE